MCERENAPLAGFVDAEALILSMLQEMTRTETERAKHARERVASSAVPAIVAAWTKREKEYRVRAGVLAEIELAVRMGQHRSAEHGDPDLVQKAHMRAANGSAKGRAGGIKAAQNMTKEERVRRAKLAAEARYEKRRRER